MIPMRMDGRFVRRYRRRYAHHITYSSGAVRLGVPLPASVVGPPASRSRQHNAIRRFGGPRPESAPAPVVHQSRGRHSAPSPEGDPPRFLGLRHPGALEAADLVERHDVAHGGGVYTRAGRDGRIRLPGPFLCHVPILHARSARFVLTETAPVVCQINVRRNRP